MIDFALWDELLRRYVDERGRVDYGAWKAEEPQTLSRWLADRERLDLPAALSSAAAASLPHPDERLALWLNLYNAYTIASVLERYPLASIRPQLFGVPNWLAFLWFFYRPLSPGRRYSLNGIEHGILRRQFNEPRIHFALVCASIGCPLLRKGAYWGESARSQLEDDATRFINNPDKVKYDAKTGTLYCSQIFKWYERDFLKVAPSVQDYIRSYLKTDDAIASNSPIAYLPYDWNLNQRISS